MRYTWADGGEPQEGLLVIGPGTAGSVVDASWVDSWHMSVKMMLCRGEVRGDGGLSVRGSYAAPPGPDWGWRIALALSSPQALTMYNVTPAGEKALAVAAVYARPPMCSVSPMLAKTRPTSPRGTIPNPTERRSTPPPTTPRPQICLPAIAAMVSATIRSGAPGRRNDLRSVRIPISTKKTGARK